MEIQNEFNDIAKDYDANRRKFIPCFDEFYDESTDFLSSVVAPPEHILDLGAGTGLLTYYWMKHFPDADYELVDAADKMLDVARRRFCGSRNVKYTLTDYVGNFTFTHYDAVISALSVHHLKDQDKLQLFRRIYEALPPGGVFVNYDQFCADNSQMNGWINKYWEDYVMGSGLDDFEILQWRKRQKLDRECSVNREICMLTDEAKFETAECIYRSGKFAVIAAVKAKSE